MYIHACVHACARVGMCVCVCVNVCHVRVCVCMCLHIYKHQHVYTRIAHACTNCGSTWHTLNACLLRSNPATATALDHRKIPPLTTVFSIALCFILWFYQLYALCMFIACTYVCSIMFWSDPAVFSLLIYVSCTSACELFAQDIARRAELVLETASRRKIINQVCICMYLRVCVCVCVYMA